MFSRVRARVSVKIQGWNYPLRGELSPQPSRLTYAKYAKIGRAAHNFEDRKGGRKVVRKRLLRLPCTNLPSDQFTRRLTNACENSGRLMKKGRFRSREDERARDDLGVGFRGWRGLERPCVTAGTCPRRAKSLSKKSPKFSVFLHASLSPSYQPLHAKTRATTRSAMEDSSAAPAMR